MRAYARFAQRRPRGCNVPRFMRVQCRARALGGMLLARDGNDDGDGDGGGDGGEKPRRPLPTVTRLLCQAEDLLSDMHREQQPAATLEDMISAMADADAAAVDAEAAAAASQATHGFFFRPGPDGDPDGPFPAPRPQYLQPSDLDPVGIAEKVAWMHASQAPAALSPSAADVCAPPSGPCSVVADSLAPQTFLVASKPATAAPSPARLSAADLVATNAATSDGGDDWADGGATDSSSDFSYGTYSEDGDESDEQDRVDRVALRTARKALQAARRMARKVCAPPPPRLSDGANLP